jgi:low affinity Fe/Cu permease
MPDETPSHPTEVSEKTSWFDRLADRMSRTLARAPFFLACVGTAVVWAVTGPFVHFTHGWVDALEVVATLVTFLIVALLQNEGWRGNKATQRKLNAIASALAELMEKAEVNEEQVRQLNAAVGLEKRESSTH